MFLAFLFFAMVVCAEDTIDRKVILQVTPEYPAVLKASGIGGVVRLTVTINADGNVKSAVLLGGNAALAESAITAMKKWKYSSTGQETTGTVSFTFDPKK